MFTAVDNMFMGEGFAWVIEDLPGDERWKYNLHGDFAERDQAEEIARNLNLLWENV